MMTRTLRETEDDPRCAYNFTCPHPVGQCPTINRKRGCMLREMIREKSVEYCSDVQRATGDMCLSPELLAEYFAAIAREAIRQAVSAVRENRLSGQAVTGEIIADKLLGEERTK